MKTALMSLVVVAVAGVPGIASAATASSDGSTAAYRAAPGEVNRLQLVGAFGPLQFADAGATITAGAGCSALAGGVVQCDGFDVDAALGDKADVASLNSFAGDVALDAGSGADDVLVGANARASALGGSGDDTIVVVSNGLGRADGGIGNDALAGRSFGDALEGGDGNDLLTENGGPASETLAGEDGADRLVGTSGVAELTGGAGADLLLGPARLLDGGAGGDRIQSSGGATVRGGGGNDIISARDGSGAPDDITCGAGYDVVYSDAEVDTVAGDCEVRLTTAAPALPGAATARADAAALLAHRPSF